MRQALLSFCGSVPYPFLEVEYSFGRESTNQGFIQNNTYTWRPVGYPKLADMRVMLLSKIEFQLKTRSFGMTFAAIVDRYVRTVTTREFPL